MKNNANASVRLNGRVPPDFKALLAELAAIRNASETDVIIRAVEELAGREGVTITTRQTRNRNKFFEKGEVAAWVQRVLSQQHQPLPTPDLIEIIVQEKGLELTDDQQISIRRSLNASMQQMAKKGLITEAFRAKGIVYWQDGHRKINER